MMKHYDTLWVNNHLRLTRMMSSRKEAWTVAWLLGMVTLVATITLLALSGWFITAAGLAGFVSLASAYTFNYFGPAAIIRLCAIVRTAGRYGERLASHNAVLALLADLRSSLFAKLAISNQRQSVSMKQMHRLTSDIDLLNTWPLSLILPASWAIVMLALIVLLTALVGGTLAYWVAIPMLVATVLIPWLAAYQGQNWANKQTNEAEIRRLALLRPLSAITALLQWKQWSRFSQQFKTCDAHYVAGQLRQQSLSGMVVLLQQLCLAITSALLLWQGAYLMMAHILSIPMLLALLLAIFGYSEIVLQLGMQMMAWGLSRAACHRLNDLLDGTIPSDDQHEMHALPQQIHMRAEHLVARFPSALNGADDVNFDLNNGEVLLITGPSGAGKSTLLEALAYELPPISGQLTINDQPLSYWALSGQVAYLSQQLDIFDLSLAQNLRLGKEQASDDELWQVLEKVSLSEWARRQPKKLDTPLGEYGAAVSGGQARRIALARLLLKPYPLMILDEPFAGLDKDTRQNLASMLRQHQKHGLLVVVSHQSLPWDDAKSIRIG